MFSDKGTFLGYVTFEEPNGSDAGFYDACYVCHAQTSGWNG